MKKSAAATLLVFFLLIPLTLFLGLHLPGKGHYLTSTLVNVEILIPFFLLFEGRKPQARELVIIAVLCAIAIVSRVAIPLPHFKPTFAIIMLAGVAFGPETGFMVGALTAFGSNFFVGQGAFTPWQMMAYGAGGLLAGWMARKGWLKKRPVSLAVFGFLASFLWVGPLLDLCTVFLTPIDHTVETVLAIYATGVMVNLIHAGSAAVTMLIFGRPLLEKLDRIKVKYGMMAPEETL